jgi:hypothetical protein
MSIADVIIDALADKLSPGDKSYLWKSLHTIERNMEEISAIVGPSGTPSLLRFGNVHIGIAEGITVFDPDTGNKAIVIEPKEGIKFEDTKDDTTKIRWYYNDNDTLRILSWTHGDYAGGSEYALHWVMGYRNADSPWLYTGVLLGAWDEENDIDGRLTMYTSTAVNDVIMQITNSRVYIEKGLAVGVYDVALTGGDIHAAGDVFNTEWTPYHDTSTITGWSNFTNKYIYYKKVGNLVFVKYRLSGTSNSQSTSFTLPHAAASGIRTTFKPARARDNGTWLVGAAYGHVTSGGSTAIFFTNESTSGGTSWTNSGTKEIHGEFFYEAG